MKTPILVIAFTLLFLVDGAWGQNAGSRGDERLGGNGLGQRQNQGQRQGQNRGQGGGGDDWNQSEYSGRHSPKDISMALYSKGFAWLSGSPADNEKLSIGKNAQFFGFVALRYQSGRVAKRGELGRAFHELASPEQRDIILDAAKAEQDPLAAWWETRSKILRKLEHHLYTGEAIDENEMKALAHKFGWLNAEVALYESRAYSAVEDLLTEDQWKKLRAIRENPGLAATVANDRRRIRANGVSEEVAAQYEDLFAKAFSWLTGTMEDNQILPLGQPAQFFGFVSIRHKSGHGASRGKISKQFQQVLNSQQRKILKDATAELFPMVAEFKAKRTELLVALDGIRKDPEHFSIEHYRTIANELGFLEIQCAVSEAQSYHRIRSTMTEKQSLAMMEIRSEYILDPKEMESLSVEQRGEALYNLCHTCHSNPQIAPSLENLLGRPISGIKGYDYSDGLKKAAEEYGHWTAETLDAFLARPNGFAPGTKMGFQGLLNPIDRNALIAYLREL